MSCFSTLLEGVPVNNVEAPAATDDARTIINTTTRIFLVATTVFNKDIPIFLMLVFLWTFNYQYLSGHASRSLSNEGPHHLLILI